MVAARMVPAMAPMAAAFPSASPSSAAGRPSASAAASPPACSLRPDARVATTTTTPSPLGLLPYTAGDGGKWSVPGWQQQVATVQQQVTIVQHHVATEQQYHVATEQQHHVATEQQQAHQSSKSNNNLEFETNAIYQALEAGELARAVDSLEALVHQQQQQAADQHHHQKHHVTVDNHVFYRALKACTLRKDLALGARIHALAVTTGHASHTFLANHIIRMYASQGRLQDAMAAFAGPPSPDCFMWFSIIQAHAQAGHPHRAVQLYRQMRNEGAVLPDGHVFAAVLKACAAAGDLRAGEEVHADIARSCRGRGRPDRVLTTCLVDMYAKCGSLDRARRVFDDALAEAGDAVPDVVTWNAMLAGYAQHGMGQEALDLYSAMQQQRKIGGRGDPLLPSSSSSNPVTFVCLLQACASVGALQQGRDLHAQIVRRGLDRNTIVSTCLVDMYAKCGSLDEARRVFDAMPARTEVTWTAMITAYARLGLGHDALHLYAQMQEWQQQGGVVSSDPVTLVSLLRACGTVGAGALQQGKDIHAHITRTGGLADNSSNSSAVVMVGNCLVDMYVKCGSLADARGVFDGMATKDVVTWNSMIAGYAHQQGRGQEALALYHTMCESQQQEQATPAADRLTYVALLQACANEGALHQGKQLHSHIVQRGLQDDAFVGNSLVDMYAKCGSLDDARAVFDSMAATRDVVTWTAMLGGYVQHEMGAQALALYSRMHPDDMAAADSALFLCLFQACGSVGALQQGKDLHAQVRRRGLHSLPFVTSALVDMYSKCGSLEDARSLLLDTCSSTSSPHDYVVAWSALLGGYAHHNDGPGTIRCFQEMLDHGVQPDHVSFISLLVACSHDGLVEEGQRYFSMMQDDYGIQPAVEHYNCMVDLLARSGHLDQALDMLLTMPPTSSSNVVGWMSLLTACKSHRNMELGHRCFTRLVQMDPADAAPYVLMANIYANSGMWEDVARVESLRKSAGAWKKPARACIEVKKQVHQFIVGQAAEESAELRRQEEQQNGEEEEKQKQQEEEDAVSSLQLKTASVTSRLRQEGGYVPKTELVLRSGGAHLSENEKEDALCGHAEKLALAYGLMHTPEGTPLLVTKNLRMCDDCHSSTKIMSTVEKREIVVRDAHRVHRFIKGSCSCGDRH